MNLEYNGGYSVLNKGIRCWDKDASAFINFPGRSLGCYFDFIRIIVPIKYTGRKTHSLGEDSLPI